MTETADNYADENSTVAERTSLHVETYINSDIMINLVISYLILSDWIKFKVSTRKFQETHTWWRTLLREDAVEKQISDKIVRNPRTHRIRIPIKVKTISTKWDPHGPVPVKLSEVKFVATAHHDKWYYLELVFIMWPQSWWLQLSPVYHGPELQGQSVNSGNKLSGGSSE